MTNVLRTILKDLRLLVEPFAVFFGGRPRRFVGQLNELLNLRVILVGVGFSCLPCAIRVVLFVQDLKEFMYGESTGLMKGSNDDS